ncbi:hypothetical protein ACWGIB_09620 [Streptomyces xiamenensis]
MSDAVHFVLDDSAMPTAGHGNVTAAPGKWQGRHVRVLDLTPDAP